MKAPTLDTDLMVGRLVGNYRLVAKIGSGGMGAVYRAEHILLGKPAAVKVLLPERCLNREVTDRFFNEAKAASLIRHPGIVDIFDFGRLDDLNAYIVMELLEGEGLGDRLRREDSLGAHAAASIARHVAGALGAAHAHGIIHRDLKPDNVFLVPDPTLPRGERAKLLDFGIAKLQTTAGDLVKTDTGRLMGTPYYMSPEQCRGAGRVDHRTDHYSLGCVLYQMLAGRPPFVLEGAGEILAAHIYEAPPPPSAHVAVPASLEEVVMRLLAKDPAERYASMDEVAAALNQAVVRFAGEELLEPSLAESDKFRTRRTSRATFREDATTVVTSATEAVVRGARVRRRWLVAAVPLSALAGVGLARMIGGGDGRPAPRIASPVVATPAAPPAAAWSEPVIASLAEADAGPTGAARARVTIALSSEPPGAAVYREVDGVRLGRTPLVIELGRGGGEAALVMKLRGYRTEYVALPVSRDQQHHVVLRARREGVAIEDVGVRVRAAADAGTTTAAPDAPAPDDP